LSSSESLSYGQNATSAAADLGSNALFPDSVNAPVQYGARITASVIYLLHYQLLPENRLATLMVDLFGVKVATATIARMSRACAERLHGFVEMVRDLVAGASVMGGYGLGAAMMQASPHLHRWLRRSLHPVTCSQATLRAGLGARGQA
jgi:hypothetical protein